jgi:phosphoribosylformylglycinamidine cyclo-ligase
VVTIHFNRETTDRITIMDRVDYNSLDKAKLAFIEASKKTLGYADRFGSVPQNRLGASANVFSFNLAAYLQAGNKTDCNLNITLIAEGLGTADDACPNDLTAAERKQFWHNIGIKTISALTNDAASAGMQTILISLYLPSSNPENIFSPDFLEGFTGGIVTGCKIVGCTWISGETPQLKGKLCDDKLDIAGALFAVMPPGITPIDGSRLAAGNKIVLVASSGPHENGFTTLRGVAAKLPQGYRSKLPNGQQFWQAINAPSILYSPLVQALLAAKVDICGLENITGHGWLKLMRSKKSLCYKIEKMLPALPVFTFVEEKANLNKMEMLQTFNCGAGFAIYVSDNQQADNTIAIAEKLGYKALQAGVILPSSSGRRLIIDPLGLELTDEQFLLAKN